MCGKAADYTQKVDASDALSFRRPQWGRPSEKAGRRYAVFRRP
ncbi:hypothetical protein NEIELOOT_02668 [Neisseria elongata subsp. glycolytica ATCC 29315]|uniref:Uncharacterized protein n=1 Tax=Neisseria elongata subsp. glycolytica ATCC 29315 TaxID=546263 RepID=D4DUA9_NEIEG|nr:hypothetical protein NEIELOOT_02668 [Neisseria elongata subsp. glycolytica ATCC 29315]